jgi:uncharacterized membrane protein
MRNKANHVLGRRWAATILDYIVCFCFLLIPNLVFGKEIYQRFIWLWLILLLLYFPLIEGSRVTASGNSFCAFGWWMHKDRYRAR